MQRPQTIADQPGSLGEAPPLHDHKNVIVADEVHVGPLVITKTPDGGVGIWFGTAKNGPMISLFQTKGKCGETGVGIYARGAVGPCRVCLCLDQDEAGAIQFARGEEVVFLTFDMVKKLAQSAP
jgi:hypothetical protein